MLVRTAQTPRRHRLQLWPSSGAPFCTRRIRNARLPLALPFLGATLGTWFGCTLVSARSSCQVRTWQSHARTRSSSRITRRFVLRFVDSATIYLGYARTQPVLSRHGFRPGSRPDQLLPMDGMGYFLRFPLRQPFPWDIPQKSSTWRWQLPHITCQDNVQPSKGTGICGIRCVLALRKSRTNSRQRNSNRAKSSALTMLISSMISHRQRNALALRSRSLCPLMRSSPRPCQFKPNAWWMVSPFKSLAITACSVTTWNLSPSFQPKISSNNSFRIRFNTYDFPVPGPPCTAHRNGSRAPRLSEEISWMTWSATFLQTSASVYLSICLSVYLSIYLSLCIYLSLYVSIYLSFFLSFSPSLSLSPPLSTGPPK